MEFQKKHTRFLVLNFDIWIMNLKKWKKSDLEHNGLKSKKINFILLL